jgi:hypothetical protein
MTFTGTPAEIPANRPVVQRSSEYERALAGIGMTQIKSPAANVDDSEIR